MSFKQRLYYIYIYVYIYIHTVYICLEKKGVVPIFAICFSFIIRFQINLGMHPFQSKFCKFKKHSAKNIPVSTNLNRKKKNGNKNPPPRDPRATSTGNSNSNGKSKAMTRKGRDSVEPLADPRGISILTTWRIGSSHDLESRG